jgi:hypothetical protein
VAGIESYETRNFVAKTVGGGERNDDGLGTGSGDQEDYQFGGKEVSGDKSSSTEIEAPAQDMSGTTRTGHANYRPSSHSGMR